MVSDTDLKKMAAEVQRLRAAAENLSQMGDDFPALARNSIRILASAKMLELNISDCVDLEAEA